MHLQDLKDDESYTIVTAERGKVYVAKAAEEIPEQIRRLTLYYQASFSLIVAFICGWVIITTPENSSQKAVPWSVLTTTIGFWMPSPTSKR